MADVAALPFPVSALPAGDMSLPQAGDAGVPSAFQAVFALQADAMAISTQPQISATPAMSTTAPAMAPAAPLAMAPAPATTDALPARAAALIAAPAAIPAKTAAPHGTVLPATGKTLPVGTVPACTAGENTAPDDAASAANGAPVQDTPDEVTPVIAAIALPIATLPTTADRVANAGASAGERRALAPQHRLPPREDAPDHARRITTPAIVLPAARAAQAELPSAAAALATLTVRDGPIAAPTGAETTAGIAPAAAAPFAAPMAQTASFSALPAREAPQDFAGLVDRLVQARETAMPHTLHAAITHADFGEVQLRFEQNDSGLSVAMSSADPAFARAAQSAALAQNDTPSARADTSQSGAGQAGGQQSTGSTPRDGGQPGRDARQSRAAAADEDSHGAPLSRHGGGIFA